LNQDKAIFGLFTHKAVVFIGAISYSLYLWHWGVLTISRWTIGTSWTMIPAQLALMLFAAIFSYRFIETPLRRLRFRKRWLVFGLGAGGVAAAGAWLHTLNAFNLRLYAGTKFPLRNQALFSASTKSCSLFMDGKKATAIADSCRVNLDAKRPTIYALGDSHIAQFKEAIADFAQRNRYNYAMVWGTSCMFPAAVVRLHGLQCYDLQTIVEKNLLANVRPGDIVFIGNALYNRFSWSPPERYFQPNGQEMDIRTAAATFSNRFKQVADRLNEKGAKVVLYIDGVHFPGLESSGALCKSEWFRPKVSAAKPCFTSLDAHRRNIDANFAWRNDWHNGRTRFTWNAYEYAKDCSRGICRATFNIDNNHFREDYAAFVLESFLRDNPGLLNPRAALAPQS
jgi:hypothetical protein